MHEYILNDVAQVYSRKSDELEMIKCDVCGKQWNGKRKYVSNNNEFPVILCRKCAKKVKYRNKNETRSKKFLEGNRIYGVVAEDCILGKRYKECCFCGTTLIKKKVKVLLYDSRNLPVKSEIFELKFCEKCSVPFWNYKMVLNLRKKGLHVKSIGNLKDFNKNFWKLAIVNTGDFNKQSGATKIVKTPPQTELDKVTAIPSNNKVIKVHVDTTLRTHQLDSRSKHKNKEKNIKMCSKCRLNPAWLEYSICFDCYMKEIEAKKEKHQHHWSGGTGYGIE